MLLLQLESKQGHIVITMLLDVNGFWKYDNRESFLSNNNNSNNNNNNNNEPEPSNSILSIDTSDLF